LFEREEIQDMIYIILALTVMFAILSSRFSDLGVIGAFFSFLIFFSFLLTLRQLFMKFIAYRIGFSLTLHQTYFSKWGFKKYENIKAFGRDFSDSTSNKAMDLGIYNSVEKEKLPFFTKKNKFKIKGIPSIVLSLCLYVFSFGFIIFPSVWRYKVKMITHRFIGTKHRFENIVTRNVAISDVRVVKALFMGYVFYFIFAIFLKLFLPIEGITLWFYFALFWIAFTTLIPLIGTEGYEIYMRNRFAYISAVTILALGMLSLFIFSSLLSVILISIPIILLVLGTIYYKQFLFA
jgi:hypothetical protein